ncbi:MAG: HD domain-containing protein [Cryobacterium sp.]|nr:HD domain-containing protein [Cryobacterium sp.]
MNSQEGKTLLELPSEKVLAQADSLRDSVVTSLPLINTIEDVNLREKVVSAWALSLALNDYSRIEEMPGSGMPQAPVKGTQADHLQGVALIALTIKHSLEEVHQEPLPLSDDVLLASALCHDLGKTFEYNQAHRDRWEANSRVSGAPAVRHPAYGAHVAMLVGLPEAVVHVCAAHSPEGRFVQRSLAATIVHHADDSYWFTLEKSEQWSVKVPRL